MIAWTAISKPQSGLAKPPIPSGKASAARRARADENGCKGFAASARARHGGRRGCVSAKTPSSV